MRNPIIILIGCTLFACSAAQTEFEVGGHRFCISRDHDIPKVSWIKPDGHVVRDSGGAAISNCLINQVAGNNLVKSECLFERQIESVAIDNDDGFRIKTEVQEFAKSLLGRVTLAADTSRTVVDDGHLLVMENQRIWGDWFLWQQSAVLPDDALVFHNGYIFLASCRKSKSRIGASRGKFRYFFECYRTFVNQGLLISYSFESSNKVPLKIDITKTDRSILSGLNKMKCQAE